MLTAADVTAARFAPTRFRPGYVQDEVDAVLDRVARALEARHTATILGTTSPITADELTRVTFTVTRWREGYDQREVDDLLDRAAAALRA